MRILIEAHHPGDIHFWKYPVKDLLERGNKVLMIARDRDVMRQLVEAYDWIPHVIPKRSSNKNRFPLKEMLSRQWAVAKAIHEFRPDVVGSLFGSYCQSAGIMGCPNVIFTDSEFQHFNHRIAHPFADAVYTPDCFWKDLGPKQVPYRGIHELAFLDGRRFSPDKGVLERHGNLVPHEYLVIRLSAWNTFHDINHQGIGKAVFDFINHFKKTWRIVISAEENQLPEELRPYAMPVPPEDFHHVLSFARFVLTEGASTASEAACLGIPTVYINSTEPRGYLQMLEDRYGLVRNFRTTEKGMPVAIDWCGSINEETIAGLREQRTRLIEEHCDVTRLVVKVLEGVGDR